MRIHCRTPFLNSLPSRSDAPVCYFFCLPPSQNKVFEFLDGLSDEALKKESSTEAKGDTISSIMKVGGRMRA